MRRHVVKMHPEFPVIEFEYGLAKVRYPEVNLEELTERYRSRLETIFTIRDKGIFIEKLLTVLGILRTRQADVSLSRVLKKGAKTPEDVKRIYTESLVGTFLKKSKEQRFKGYLNRDMARLRNEGLEELIPAATALKVTKFIRERLEEELEKAKTEAEPTQAPSEPEPS